MKTIKLKHPVVHDDFTIRAVTITRIPDTAIPEIRAAANEGLGDFFEAAVAAMIRLPRETVRQLDLADFRNLAAFLEEACPNQLLRGRG
ncbi:phage tail assembly protein [Roseovarius sp.]|uniref:phage tail assembly protein n=1 Tax=Roseovarius sp. TaxID=1486281 RepID=UPI003BAB182D